MLKIKFIAFYLTLTLLGTKSYAQPSIAWQQCFGGTSTDYFTDAKVTFDNGIITCITTSSIDGDLEGLDSAFGWVIKFDSLLAIEWQQFYGRPDLAITPKSVIQLSDSSFVFYGFGGEGTNGFQGQLDFMLMKTDKLGNLLWHKSYGGPGLEDIDGLITTSDGGFLFTGQSAQEGGDIPFHYGDIFSQDANVVKTDSEGNIEWLKNLGGTGIDGCIGTPVETAPGKYQIHIYTTSEDFDLIGNDIPTFQKRWVIELNNAGEIEKQAFYEAEEHFLRSDGQTGIISGNRTIAIGSSLASSTLYPAPEGHAGEEGAIGIFNVDLDLIDVRMFGGSSSERYYRYHQDANFNYYFLGYSYSLDYDLPGNYDSGKANDYWILKTDSNFNKIWSRNFGGTYPSGELSGLQWDGSLVLHNNQLICFMPSVPQALPDYDIQCGFIPDPPPAFKRRDAWMVVFDLPNDVSEVEIEQNVFKIYPNPNSGSFQIQFNSRAPDKQLTVYNINGEKVYSTQVIENDQATVVLPDLPNGLYCIFLSGQAVYLSAELLLINK